MVSMKRGYRKYSHGFAVKRSLW